MAGDVRLELLPVLEGDDPGLVAAVVGGAEPELQVPHRDIEGSEGIGPEPVEDPHLVLLLLHRVRSFGAFPVPGGIRSRSPSAALRGAATPPWTPCLLHGVRSFGAFPAPGGIRSLSPSAPLRGAATPPWTPLLLPFPGPGHGR